MMQASNHRSRRRVWICKSSLRRLSGSPKLSGQPHKILKVNRPEKYNDIRETDKNGPNRMFDLRMNNRLE